jgi:hypothetical protein
MIVYFINFLKTIKPMKKLEIIETADYVLAVSKTNDNIYTMYIEDIIHSNSALAYQPKGNAPELDLPLLPNFQQRLLNKDGSEIRKVDLSEKHKDLLPEINTPKYRVGKKQKRAVLDEKGHEVVIFPVGREKEAQEYCDFLNSKEIVVEDDVEKLAKIATSKLAYSGPTASRSAECFIWIKGYKAATKVYSEEDLRKAIKVASGERLIDEETQINAIIQSLKQPKTPKWFVAETETVKGKYIGRVQIGTTPSGEPIRINEGYEEIQRLKTTTCSGKTYLVGKFVNE